MYTKEQIDAVLRALRANNMEATFVESRSQIMGVLDGYLQDGAVVAVGGSVTLNETGVLSHIYELDSQGKIKFLDRYAQGLTREEAVDVMRQAFLSDVFVTSTNAITADGYLYNVDGNGNRVAAMIFGPKRVVVIAGYNKLVESHHDAVRRVRQIAAPKNVARLNLNAPCSQTGQCMQCHSQDRICCSYTFLGQQREKGRIHVILVGEELGY